MSFSVPTRRASIKELDKQVSMLYSSMILEHIPPHYRGLAVVFLIFYVGMCIGKELNK
jgi:uncharacterized membrane protein